MRQKQHARQLEGADRAASAFRVTAKSEARNIGLDEVRRDAVRRQRLAAAVNRPGERVAFDPQDELARSRPEITRDLDQRLAAYAERLSPAVLRVTGGDRFAPSLVRAIQGGR